MGKEKERIDREDLTARFLPSTYAIINATTTHYSQIYLSLSLCEFSGLARPTRRNKEITLGFTFNYDFTIFLFFWVRFTTSEFPGWTFPLWILFNDVNALPQNDTVSDLFSLLNQSPKICILQKCICILQFRMLSLHLTYTRVM